MKRRTWTIIGILATALYGMMTGERLEKAAAAAGATRVMPVPADRVGSLRLDLTRVGSVPALVRQTEVIVLAHPFEGAPERHATSRSAAGGAKLVHYVQRLHVLETIKGQAPSGLRLVLPGAEPLPQAKDPLHDTFPGPLADDEAYVLFLQPTGLAGLYTAVGGRQGIYPVGDDGRTAAFSGAGFPQLGGLTPAELRMRIRTLPTRS